ncbi:hypothetical protein Taro_008226 [Colocasia esculenta]|uniref:Anthocyanin 5-aromatic acyltransferase n=1 Tax=Colocasia esculenta TaxID=4460 RepID=A0A843U0J9_COLES|nr:hypothetical protein [Colocasia esculenta]
MAPSEHQQAPPPMTKILERCLVAPAPGTVKPSALPLTFFDYIFLPFHPVQRVFFYELPCSRLLFLSDHLPHLKLSLSLALLEFRPLAGSLVLPPQCSSPEVRCGDGDAVEFTVAECSDNFHYLAGNHARDAARLHPLVPQLLLPGVGSRRAPVLALQATIFPGVGVAVGIAVQHAVADGSTSAHFLKTWAATCRLGRKGVLGVSCVGGPPTYDRTVIRDPMRLGRTFLADLQMLREDSRMEAWDLAGRSDIVRGTFIVTNEKIQQLSQRFTSKTSLECSPYTLASGLVWVCLVKAKGLDDVGGDTTEHFGFVTGCRARMDPQAPATYFGNCLGICCVEASRSDLVGEDGAVAASTAIRKVIRGVEERGGAFRGAENWIRDIFRLAALGILTVAGSPKLGMYQVDFGWGRPRKVEMVSIERTGAMSIAEAKEEEGGGLEFGLVLPREEMARFSGFFADGLKQLSCSWS